MGCSNFITGNDLSQILSSFTASKQENEIYSSLPLQIGVTDGRVVLKRTNLDFFALDKNGLCELDRIQSYVDTHKEYSPMLGNEKIELHHVGQKMSSPFAELTTKEHRRDNFSILHNLKKESEIDRKEYHKERVHHWQARAQEEIEKSLYGD